MTIEDGSAVSSPWPEALRGQVRNGLMGRRWEQRQPPQSPLEKSSGLLPTRSQLSGPPCNPARAGHRPSPGSDIDRVAWIFCHPPFSLGARLWFLGMCEAIGPCRNDPPHAETREARPRFSRGPFLPIDSGWGVRIRDAVDALISTNDLELTVARV